MCEYTAEQTANEIRRLTARKRSFENAAERPRGIVIWVIMALGKDDKGKPRKLQGAHFTLSARACPNTVRIEYESLVPDAYKRVRVNMPAEQWAMICERLSEPFPVATYYIDGAALKTALESGIEVDGAQLETGRMALQIR
ncbi:MAG: hypothetical protein JWO19_5724 [Bryobacterales bacterium]|nr:hypothetical protein [Bryobacterales bacterium]